MRQSIHAATNKVESFHFYHDWITVGGATITTGDLLLFLQDGSIFQQVNLLKGEKKLLGDHQEILREDVNHAYRELEISNIDLERKSVLFEDGVISELDFENTELVNLKRKRATSSADIIYSNNNISKFGIEKEIELLVNQRYYKVKQLVLEVRKNVVAFELDLENWRYQNIIYSRSSGILSTSLIELDRPYVNSGDLIFTIIPIINVENIILTCKIPSEYIGSIEIGSNVNFQFEAYPHQEFGTIQARISEISLIPINHNKEEELTYFAKANIAYPIVTSYHDTIPFRNKLKGIAKMTTTNKNLIQRKYEELKSLLIN